MVHDTDSGVPTQAIRWHQVVTGLLYSSFTSSTRTGCIVRLAVSIDSIPGWKYYIRVLGTHVA
jgi:hypothetical protein